MVASSQGAPQTSLEAEEKEKAESSAGNGGQKRAIRACLNDRCDNPPAGSKPPLFPSGAVPSQTPTRSKGGLYLVERERFTNHPPTRHRHPQRERNGAGGEEGLRLQNGGQPVPMEGGGHQLI